MKTVSPEWSITGQDHNIWSKMPLGQLHLQQLSLSLMLTLGSWEAAWCVLHAASTLHNPDSCKILTCSFGFSQALFLLTPLPTISLIFMFELSLASYPLPSTDPQGKAGDSYTTIRAEQCNVDRCSARGEGVMDPLLLLFFAPSPSLLTSRLYLKTTH